MIKKFNLIIVLVVLCPFAAAVSCREKMQTAIRKGKMMNVQIILGSTRQGRMSEKIALVVKEIADKRQEIEAEIIDLRDFNLPFLNDAIAPSRRQEITDPLVKRWSETVKKADGFIIILPEYNAGYPGVLKNALDSLYPEWSGKPVGFIGYSGGPNGGAGAIAQLLQVVQELNMKPIEKTITIPTIYQKITPQGNLIIDQLHDEIIIMIDQLIAARSH